MTEIIDYHIAETSDGWGIFREGMQIAVRKDPADAIAFANFFADRETLATRQPVMVSADSCLHRMLGLLRAA